MATTLKLLNNTRTSEQLLSLGKRDTWRGDQAIHLNSLSSLFLSLKEWICGPTRSVNDRTNFSSLYRDSIKHDITLLHQHLDTNPQSEEAFGYLRTLLKIETAIQTSSWGKNLKHSTDYIEFSQQIKILQNRVATSVKDWAGGDLERDKLARWVTSSSSQRQFAAHLKLKDVPYRFNEIPKGAVILTDPFLYLQSAKLKRKQSILKTALLNLKSFLCWAATGKRYTHAELSLGEGESFDLDKANKGWIPTAQMRIAKRGDNTCYGAVYVPNQKKMLAAHQEAYLKKGLTPYETFEALFAAIEAEARESQPHITGSIGDIIRVGIVSPRPKDYDAMEAWDPQNKHYGCSATTSALFSKFGIDIGVQFGKKDQNVSPADFSNSEFFEEAFAVT